VEIPYLHFNRYGIAFLEGDVQEMQRQVEWAGGCIGEPIRARCPTRSTSSSAVGREEHGIQAPNKCLHLLRKSLHTRSARPELRTPGNNQNRRQID